MGSPATDTAPEALRAACDDVRAATATDVVDGVAPRWVARPAGTEEVAAVLRGAAGLGLRTVARGSGTKLGWGTPPRALDLIVDTGRLAAVLTHATGDLVVTVQAGLRLTTLQDALAPHRQRLALDGTGTVGGTIATAAAGPLRYRYGAARDLIIGITVVLADGTVARAGGTVVKNVAGYDLAKLYTGSLGTLGIITEAVFRLHPRPEANRWVTVGTAEPDRAAAAVAAVRDSPSDPVALEVDRAVAGGPVTLGIAVEGVAESIDARAGDVATALSQATGTQAGIADAPPQWWGRPPDPPEAAVVALSCEPTGLGELLTRAPGALRGSAGAGVFSVGLADDDRLGAALGELRRIAARHGGHAVLRCAAPDRKASLDVWGPVPALALMRRLKDEFDPGHLLAPGRFVGGI
jgi:glycolate oxidase FAD binding subunit